MKLNVEKLKQGNIIKAQNGVQVDNTRTSVKEKVKPIPLNQEQQQNFKLYGSLNRPEVKQTYLSQGRKLTPTEQQASNKKLAGQEKLQNYQKRKEKEAEDLEKAITVAPYVIPGLGQAMWAGKAIDLAINGASKGKYESWGDMVDQNVGGSNSEIDKFTADLTNPGYYAGVVGKLATPLIKKSIQRIPINYSNYSNLRSIEIPRFKSFTNSFNDQKALQTALDQFTNRNTFYRGVKGAQNLDEAAQMLTTVDGKIRPRLRQGVPEGNNSGVIYSSVNPKRAEVFAGNQGYVGKVTPVQIKGNNLTEFIDNNLIGNRKDLIFNKQIDGTPQLISFGNPQQQVMNLQGFVGSSNKLPITKPLINRNTNTIRKTTLNKAEPYLMGDKRIPMMGGYKPKSNFVENSFDLLPINAIKRPNGAIGTQGVTTEQVSNILTNVLNLDVPKNASMRELVDLFKSNPNNIDNLMKFTKKNPINISRLPDESFHIKDGHHRAFLLDQAGIEKIPYTNFKKQGGILKAQEGGGFINKLIKSKEYNSPLATALKIIDPTGVSSYGDVYNAWTDGKFDYNDIVEPLGAVPVFGKLGKVGKFLLKGIKGIEDFNNAKKIIKASKFVNSDVIKTGGRTFKTSFNKTFVSPYTFQEYQLAKKFIKGNPLLNYSQYGIRTIAGFDDIMDIKSQGVDLLTPLQNKSAKKQKGGLLYPKVNQLINRTNQKNINFVNRLKDPNRKFITNWENPNQIATHKMSWATDDKGATIYSNVQNIKGKLIDFTRPPYNKWAGYNSAIQNNDTIQTTPEIAQEYTTNYKKFYPQFNK